MKRISKVPEPVVFSDWKASDRMAHRPNWNRVPGEVRRALRASLIAEQGYICCYCEGLISEDDSHIEHFRPISKNEYRDLRLDYANLHCSCQRELEPGEPRHCGYRKGSWFDEDLLISPLAPDCEGRFRYTANGDIFPRRHSDNAATTTIEKLGLCLDKLRALRAAAVDALYDLPGTQVRRLLASKTDGRFVAFHTTIDQVLSI